MKVRELERILREGMKAHPSRPPLALLTGGGPLGASVSAEFAEAANTLASRARRPSSKKDGVLPFHNWI
jgi:hypothetical protein